MQINAGRQVDEEYYDSPARNVNAQPDPYTTYDSHQASYMKETPFKLFAFISYYGTF